MSKDDLAEDIIENILGNDEPEYGIYYCEHCKHPHSTNSRLGKMHWKYRRRE